MIPMFEVPAPTHGYVPVIVAFWVYVLVAATTTAGLWLLGVPGRLVVPVFAGVALALLVPFVPVFRRLTPTAPHER